MEENDYREVITMVEQRLRELGLAWLADSAAYVFDSSDADEPRLPPPRDHLAEILEAFERHLATNDSSVAELALDRINDVLAEGHIEDAQFVSIGPDGRREPVSLSTTPTLTNVRRELTALIREIRDDPSPSPRPSPSLR